MSHGFALSGSRRHVVVSGLAAILAIAAAGHAGSAPLSLHTTGGKFILNLSGIGRSERLNHLHGFTLRLATGSGEPVAAAEITLSGERGDSGNPLPTLPQVTYSGSAGEYRGAGLQFHMPGEWRLTFTIASGAVRDRATLDVVVR